MARRKNACQGKRAHSTREYAEQHRARLAAAGAAADRLRAYECGFCGRWHVGHRSYSARRPTTTTKATRR
ncbi:hypothetical protein AAFH96_05605 [Polymorphospora sp. 2-325]|uniref:Uncharacterized protein n=1 Tax=Polymorphospora lycopeni TaxID=3140240 RepID=A0ABV5CKQ0_9ACTN